MEPASIWINDVNIRAVPKVSGVSAGSDRIRILRVIARMNIGGPAYHVSLLSGKLDSERYETLLVSGNVGLGEESFAELADRFDANLLKIETMGPKISPSSDIRTVISLARLIRRFRPHIVHTHTAKAGALGRLTAAITMRPRPIIIHTFHGHVLEDFFGPVASHIFISVERLLARFTDCLVCVSSAVADDLIRLRVAPRNKFRIVPLGLDVQRFFATNPEQRARSRAALNIDPDAVVCLFSGRLVPSKRVDFMLRAFARALAKGANARLVIAGDGPERLGLEALSRSLAIDSAVQFLGFRKDIENIIAASDVAVLSSKSEGTPLFLIEASAAGRPAIATEVDGVPDIVTSRTGLLVDATSVSDFGDAIVRLASDEPMRIRMGALAQEHVRYRFSSSRLLDDIDQLYGDLLATRSSHR